MIAGRFSKIKLANYWDRKDVVVFCILQLGSEFGQKLLSIFGVNPARNSGKIQQSSNVTADYESF